MTCCHCALHFRGSPRVAGGSAAVCDPNPPRPFARSRFSFLFIKGLLLRKTRPATRVFGPFGPEVPPEVPERVSPKTPVGGWRVLKSLLCKKPQEKSRQNVEKIAGSLVHEILQSGFRLIFLLWGLANFRKNACKCLSEFFQQIFPPNFSAFFLQGFRPLQKFTPKIHVQNCRHCFPISHV